MEFLTVSHSGFLIVMSCLVALVAGFTGLSLTRDLAVKPVLQKKGAVALAAVALGGGIWAMHFVAMLGLKLPILFYYDAAITLVSALSAILIVGLALILLHFAQRTPAVISLAGAIVGIGVLVMHFIGMAGLELCRAVYTPAGVALSAVAAIGLCVLAFRMAYGQRTNRNIVLGTICFAVAVCSVHFLAIAGTRFVAEPQVAEFGPSMSNETLALGVIFFSFVMFGACLWVSVTYLVPPMAVPAAGFGPITEPETEPETGAGTGRETGPATGPEAGRDTGLPQDQPDRAGIAPGTTSGIAPGIVPETVPGIAPGTVPLAALLIPCEGDGAKVFVRARDVSFVRADGHYTQVYTQDDRLFCAWPITVASARLLPAGFLQTHRSYLVNPARVARFERTKDKGRCVFEGTDVPPAPVSRSKLKAIQDALAPHLGASRAG